MLGGFCFTNNVHLTTTTTEKQIHFWQLFSHFHLVFSMNIIWFRLWNHFHIVFSINWHFKAFNKCLIYTNGFINCEHDLIDYCNNRYSLNTKLVFWQLELLRYSNFGLHSVECHALMGFIYGIYSNALIDYTWKWAPQKWKKEIFLSYYHFSYQIKRN